jgi:hypothetical protein
LSVDELEVRLELSFECVPLQKSLDDRPEVLGRLAFLGQFLVQTARA